MRSVHISFDGVRMRNDKWQRYTTFESTRKFQMPTVSQVIIVGEGDYIISKRSHWCQGADWGREQTIRQFKNLLLAASLHRTRFECAQWIADELGMGDLNDEPNASPGNEADASGPSGVPANNDH